MDLKRHMIAWHIFLAAFILMGCGMMIGKPRLRLCDLHTGGERIGENALERLAQAHVVIVGEHHTDAMHHQAQLAVIEALYQRGEKLAIGLEMFRRDSQDDLDRWVAGKLDEMQFKPIYLANWNFAWALYRPIFLYARDHHIPMVGLNVPNGVTRQVARSGYDSLSSDQKAMLGPIGCHVTPAYRTYIREAFDAHAHSGMNFEYFCQAQLVWDNAMAANASDYLKRHPDIKMVVLTGSGHAQKQGIPAQLAKRAPWDVVVLLPEAQGDDEKCTVTAADADFSIVLQ